MPFDLGAFAKGMEPGFMGYMQIAMKKIDMEEKRAIAAGEMNFKIFTDENLPVKMRKQAYQDWGKSNKDWNTGIQAPAFPDEYWENKKLTPFFKKGLAVLKNKDYSRQQKIEILRGLEAEAIDAMGTDVKIFKPLIKQIETGMERKGVSGLFTDPQKQAAAMAGVGYKDIVKKPKTPTPSMYELQDVGDGKIQKMKWNPKTRQHDIPFGKPYKKKAEAKVGWQRKTKTYVDNGKLWKQDYDYNPKTREQKNVGKPYLSRDLGSALEQWLLSNDPKGLF